MKKELLNILVCPVCKGRLEYREKKNDLICNKDGIAFMIKNKTPVLLELESVVVSEQSGGKE